MTNRVEGFFHDYAADFDAIYGNDRGVLNALANRLFRKSMKVRYVKTLEGCRPVSGKTVLDIGCGPGHYSIALAKMNAASVLGVDFADGMLEIARRRARDEGVGDVCRFEQCDFFAREFKDSFDRVVVMGFMDYVEDAGAAVRKVLSLTREKAFFSFPVAGGLLGWQRQLRYRSRCPLFLYTREQLEKLFADAGAPDAAIERIHRDFFVTVTRTPAR